jgi:hypothetical protein
VVLEFGKFLTPLVIRLLNWVVHIGATFLKGLMPNIKVPDVLYRRAVMPKVLEDEFDTVAGVGGKHLAPKRPLDYIVSFLTLTFLSAALAGGGILGLQLWDTGVILSGLVAQEESGVSDLDLAIVDGTNSGIGVSIGEQLLEQGWIVVSSTSLSDLDPALEPAPETLIFVTAEDYRQEAEALLETFPGALIQVSSQFLAPITVLIGTDYAR